MQTKSAFAWRMLLMVLFLGISTSLFAQRTIRGTVKDSNGEPVIGASIMLVEDATKGAIADENGNFTLTVATGNSIRVSSIGFTTKEIKIGNQEVYNIVLDTDINLLDNAVAIGYGTARK